jgi:hypothetical protein
MVDLTWRVSQLHIPIRYLGAPLSGPGMTTEPLRCGLRFILILPLPLFFTATLLSPVAQAPPGLSPSGLFFSRPWMTLLLAAWLEKLGWGNHFQN